MGIKGLKIVLKEFKAVDGTPIIKSTLSPVPKPVAAATTTTTTTTDAVATPVAAPVATEPRQVLLPTPSANSTILCDIYQFLTITVNNNQAKGVDYDLLMKRNEQFLRDLVQLYKFKNIILYVAGFGHSKYERPKDGQHAKPSKRDRFCDGQDHYIQSYRFRAIEAPIMQLIQQLNEEFKSEGVNITFKRAIYGNDEQIMNHANELAIKNGDTVNYIYGDADFAFFRNQSTSTTTDAIIIYRDEGELKWFKRSDVYNALFQQQLTESNGLIAPIVASILNNDYNRTSHTDAIKKQGIPTQPEGWKVDQGCYYCHLKDSTKSVKTHTSYCCPIYYKYIVDMVVKQFKDLKDSKSILESAQLKELNELTQFAYSFGIYSLQLLEKETARLSTTEEGKQILQAYYEFNYPDFFLKPDHLESDDFPMIEFTPTLLTATEAEKKKMLEFVFSTAATSNKEIAENCYTFNKDKLKRMKKPRVHEIIHGDGEIKLFEFRFIANWRYHLFNVWQVSRYFGKGMTITKDDLLPWHISFETAKKPVAVADADGFIEVKGKQKNNNISVNTNTSTTNSKQSNKPNQAGGKKPASTQPKLGNAFSSLLMDDDDE